MWGTLIAGAIGAAGSFFGAKERADGQKDATNASLKLLREGRDRLDASALSSLGQSTVLPYNAMLGLLGVGGDPAAAQQGLRNFMDSAGYQTQLQSGQEMLQQSLASRGLQNSGAATKQAIRFGQGLGSQYFNNYLNQLMGVSQQGLSAETTRAGIDAGLAGSQADVQFRGGMAIADSEAEQIIGPAGIISNTINSIWGEE